MFMDKSDAGSNTRKIKNSGYIGKLPRDKKVAENVSLCKAQNEQMQTLKEVENRDEQFEYIAQIKQEFIDNQLSVLIIDTKKKEMIGNFYRADEVFCTEAQEVNDHDFNSFSEGVAIPHGIYDVSKNTCYLSIGTSKDTAEFVGDNNGIINLITINRTIISYLFFIPKLFLLQR
jgi:hypothetical protein